MADEEWRNYRERSNNLEHGLTNYYNHNTTNNNSNSSYTSYHSDYLPGQSHFYRTEPIHRRRAGSIDNSLHTTTREQFYCHDRTFPRSYSTRLPYTECNQYRPYSDSSAGEFTRTYPEHYPRTYSNPCPDRDVFNTPGYNPVSTSSTRLVPYDDSVSDPVFIVIYFGTQEQPFRATITTKLLNTEDLVVYHR